MVSATGGRLVHPMEKVHADISGYLSKPQDAGNYARTVGTGEYARAQLEALYRAILDVSGAVQSQYILGYAPPDAGSVTAASGASRSKSNSTPTRKSTIAPGIIRRGRRMLRFAPDP